MRFTYCSAAPYISCSISSNGGDLLVRYLSLVFTTASDDDAHLRDEICAAWILVRAYPRYQQQMVDFAFLKIGMMIHQNSFLLSVEGRGDGSPVSSPHWMQFIGKCCFMDCRMLESLDMWSVLMSSSSSNSQNECRGIKCQGLRPNGIICFATGRLYHASLCERAVVSLIIIRSPLKSLMSSPATSTLWMDASCKHDLDLQLLYGIRREIKSPALSFE